MSDTDRLAALLHELFPPPTSYKAWREYVDRTYEEDATRLIAAGVTLDGARTENPTEKVPTPPDALREAAIKLMHQRMDDRNWRTADGIGVIVPIEALRAALEADHE